MNPSSPAAAGVRLQSADARNLEQLICLSDFESAAQKEMSHSTWEYFSSGVADEITLRWNREAYDRLRLRPRVLVDVSKIDTRITLLGQQLPHPVLLAPAADQCMIHPEGEKATAQGASDAEAVVVLSSTTNTSVEDVSRNTKGPLWFQLYVQRDRGFTREMVQRAVAAGCKALCVTVDSPTFGPRNRQSRAKYQLASHLCRPHLPPDTSGDVTRGGLQVFSYFVEPALTWKDIDWVRSLSNLPVLLKGVLNSADAARAAREGLAGIIVSNHGARNLDTAPATIDALPQVADQVAGRLLVLVDGGIRRGTDVVKALALGANAVLIGRPYLYGLAVGGREGVKRVVEILRAELEMTMGLLGRTSIPEIDRSVMWS